MILVLINLVQHAESSNMTSTQRKGTLNRANPGHRIYLALEKLKIAFSSRPPHRRTILKDWENKCIEATKQHKGIHKNRSHQSQNTNALRDTRDNTTHMVFEGETAVKLHAKNVEVVTRTNGKPRQDLVTMGRVHSPGSTNH